MESDKSDRTEARPLEVPIDALSAEALAGVIDDFILREGTDYGRQEIELETKRRQIRTQLERGDIVLVFDPDSETVTLLTRQQWKSYGGQPSA